MRKIDAYVCDVLPEVIRVKVINEMSSKLLESYGFNYDSALKLWCLYTDDNNQQLEAYKFLRDNKVAFANGPAGWPPGALFEYWREQELLAGNYLSISWRNRDDYYIEER